jgi:hypothetical protein
MNFYDDLSENIHKIEIHEDFIDYVGDVDRFLKIERELQWQKQIDALQLNSLTLN